MPFGSPVELTDTIRSWTLESASDVASSLLDDFGTSVSLVALRCLLKWLSRPFEWGLDISCL